MLRLESTIKYRTAMWDGPPGPSYGLPSLRLGGLSDGPGGPSHVLESLRLGGLSDGPGGPSYVLASLRLGGLTDGPGGPSHVLASLRLGGLSDGPGGPSHFFRLYPRVQAHAPTLLHFACGSDPQRRSADAPWSRLTATCGRANVATAQPCGPERWRPGCECGHG